MNNRQGEKKIQKYAFKQSNLLGKGSYASVYKGRVLGKTDQIVAVKVINKNLFTNSYNVKNICSQIQIMKKLNHKNIVKLLDVFQTANNMYIITQYCQQGDLMNFMRKRKKIPQAQAISLIKDVLEGYKYLNQNDISHRDLKPANILLKNGYCKLIDFGFAKRLENGDSTIMSSLVGTPLYMSPQILKREKYTSKSDIWSIGLIFFELINGKTPWPAISQIQLLNSILTKPLHFSSSISISDQSKSIIKKCLQIKQEQRISWQQLFNHFNKERRNRFNDKNKQNIDYNLQRGRSCSRIHNNQKIYNRPNTPVPSYSPNAISRTPKRDRNHIKYDK